MVPVALDSMVTQRKGRAHWRETWANLTLDYISAKSAAMSYLEHICHLAEPPFDAITHVHLKDSCTEISAGRWKSFASLTFCQSCFTAANIRGFVLPLKKKKGCICGFFQFGLQSLRTHTPAVLANWPQTLVYQTNDGGFSFFLTALVWVCLCSSETFTRPSF